MYQFKPRTFGSVLLALATISTSSFSVEKSSVRPFTSPFRIEVPPQWGEITRFYAPNTPVARKRPNFILIQDVHSNQYVQQGISHLLSHLNKQGLLPSSIAVEGAVGSVPYENSENPTTRQRLADLLIADGKITGAAHYIITHGEGELYGVETKDLYKTSVDMFRRAHATRSKISGDLAKLEAALNLLKSDSIIPVSVSLLCQDIQWVRRLIGQQLVPSETHEAINHALLAVDHLRQVMPRGNKDLVNAVSSAVNFYALALLRDEAIFKQSLDLHQHAKQPTTVIVAGGFHTPGLTQRMRAQGLSYVVITPKIKLQNVAGERQYVARVMGQPISSREASRNVIFPGAQMLEGPLLSPLKKSEVMSLAEKLVQKLPEMTFLNVPSSDLLTAMDSPWLDRSVRGSLAQQRARIFSPVLTDARDAADQRVF